METITIAVEEYEKLKNDSKLLKALEAAGVDNWEGYDYAFEILSKSVYKPELEVSDGVRTFEIKIKPKNSQ